jgi:hypothetical protein
MGNALEISAPQLQSAGECSEPERNAPNAVLFKEGDALVLEQGKMRMSFNADGSLRSEDTLGDPASADGGADPPASSAGADLPTGRSDEARARRPQRTGEETLTATPEDSTMSTVTIALRVQVSNETAASLGPASREADWADIKSLLADCEPDIAVLGVAFPDLDTCSRPRLTLAAFPMHKDGRVGDMLGDEASAATSAGLLGPFAEVVGRLEAGLHENDDPDAPRVTVLDLTVFFEDATRSE